MEESHSSSSFKNSVENSYDESQTKHPNSRLKDISNSVQVDKELNSRTCKECGKILSSTAKLRRHLLTHLEVKPYECQVCRKRFKRADNLRAHLKTHVGELHCFLHPRLQWRGLCLSLISKYCLLLIHSILIFISHIKSINLQLEYRLNLIKINKIVLFSLLVLHFFRKLCKLWRICVNTLNNHLCLSIA